jgi:hypothetical protein
MKMVTISQSGSEIRHWKSKERQANGSGSRKKKAKVVSVSEKY